MLKRDKPSEYFCGAILRGYDAELQAGRVPTVAGIWNNICIECMQRPGAFQTMFQWDTSKAKNGKNRLHDIAESIQRGFVPGVALAHDAKGREVVVPS